MKIYNLTKSNLTFVVGTARVQIKALEHSSSIVSTPGLIRNNILPLVEKFNCKGILLVPNTCDMMIFDMPGCRVPAEIVVDDATAEKALAKAINEAKKELKSETKPEPKPEKVSEEVKPEVKEETIDKPELDVDEKGDTPDEPTPEAEVTKDEVKPETKSEPEVENKPKGIVITKIKGKDPKNKK